jgi:hypothetical protein
MTVYKQYFLYSLYMDLLFKLSNALKTISDYTFFEYNNHIYIDSVELYFHMIYIFEIINNYYEYNDNNDNILVKEDMSFKVFILSNCVIRFCDNNIFNNNYKNNYLYIINKDHPNLEHIYNIFTTDKYIIIISKKVIPLIIDNKINQNHKIDFDKLYNEMSDLIVDLKNDNYSHNDFRLDNIGYDNILDKYILFDFDKFSNIFKSTDNDSLIKSIHKYW